MLNNDSTRNYNSLLLVILINLVSAPHVYSYVVITMKLYCLLVASNSR